MTITNSKSQLAELIDQYVSITISDPWEFETEVGIASFSGMIIDVFVVTHIRKDSQNVIEQILVHLTKPFGYKGLKTEFLIGSPRHKGNGLTNLLNEKLISFNFYRVSKARAGSDTPFDDSRWGNDPSFSLIGGIELRKP